MHKVAYNKSFFVCFWYFLLHASKNILRLWILRSFVLINGVWVNTVSILEVYIIIPFNFLYLLLLFLQINGMPNLSKQHTKNNYDQILKCYKEDLENQINKHLRESEEDKLGGKGKFVFKFLMPFFCLTYLCFKHSYLVRGVWTSESKL